MLKLYNRLRSRRGVSPVIAVVLLIALTVAAVAVIWGFVNGYFGATDASFQYSNINVTNNGTAGFAESLTVNIELSEDASLSAGDAVVVGQSGVTVTINNAPVEFTANNEKSVTFTFDTPLETGSYELALTFNVDGQDQVENIPFSV